MGFLSEILKYTLKISDKEIQIGYSGSTDEIEKTSEIILVNSYHGRGYPYHLPI